MEFSSVEIGKYIWRFRPQPSGGPSGMRGSSKYSGKQEVEKLEGFAGRYIRRNLMRLSSDGSLPNVARICFTGRLEGWLQPSMLSTELPIGIFQYSNRLNHSHQAHGMMQTMMKALAVFSWLALIENVNVRKNAHRQGGAVKEHLSQVVVEELIAVDLRIIAAWPGPDSNIGIPVIDPGREVAYYSIIRTRSGGFALPTYYSSYEPDAYQIRRAEAAKYLIKCVKHVR